MDDDSQLSVSMVPLGTRQYMSPEQTRGGRANYTPACDIWAMGVILYELLAGYRPFSHDDPVELFGLIRRDPPPPIPEARCVPLALEAIARKCLEKHPADRYPTAEDVAADLERWLNGESVVAPLPATNAPTVTTLPEPVKTRRRPRVLLMALLAVVVAGASGALRKPAKVTPDEVPLGPLGAPVAVKSSPLERFNAGEKIVLTDAKGKPTGEVSVAANTQAGTRTRNGYQEYFSTLPAVVPLSDEPFPLPLRVTASVAIRTGTTLPSVFAVYAGRCEWGGLVPNHSFLWHGIRVGQTLPSGEPQLGCLSGSYWWERDIPQGYNRFDERLTPWNRPGTEKDGYRFVPMEIEVRDESVVGRIDGNEMKPVTAELMLWVLDDIANKNPAVAPGPFGPPVFGRGIGLLVRNSDGVVSNLTVSKIVP